MPGRVIDGELRRLDEPIELDKKFKHDISIVVDRLVMKEGLRKRLAESLEAASQLADGILEIEILDRTSGGRGRRRRGAGGRGALRPERRQARRGAGLQREVRVPELRHLDARARAADLLVQLPARLLSTLPRAWLPAGDRPGADRPRPDPLDLRGRARAVDEGRVRSTTGACSRRSPRRTGSTSDVPWRDLRRARPRAAARGHRRTSATRSRYRNRFGRQRKYTVRFEGMLAQPPAPLREHRLGEHPRAGRVADGAAAVPGVRRRPAAARRASRSRSAGSTSTSTRSSRRRRRSRGSRRSS